MSFLDDQSFTADERAKIETLMNCPTCRDITLDGRPMMAWLEHGEPRDLLIRALVAQGWEVACALMRSVDDTQYHWANLYRDNPEWIELARIRYFAMVNAKPETESAARLLADLPPPAELADEILGVG